MACSTHIEADEVSGRISLVEALGDARRIPARSGIHVRSHALLLQDSFSRCQYCGPRPPAPRQRPRSSSRKPRRGELQIECRTQQPSGRRVRCWAHRFASSRRVDQSVCHRDEQCCLEGGMSASCRTAVLIRKPSEVGKSVATCTYFFTDGDMCTARGGCYWLQVFIKRVPSAFAEGAPGCRPMNLSAGSAACKEIFGGVSQRNGDFTQVATARLYAKKHATRSGRMVKQDDS